MDSLFDSMISDVRYIKVKSKLNEEELYNWQMLY